MINKYLGEEMYDVFQDEVVVCRKLLGQNALHLGQSLFLVQSYSIISSSATITSI